MYVHVNHDCYIATLSTDEMTAVHSDTGIRALEVTITYINNSERLSLSYIYKGHSLKISPDLLQMVGEKPILAQLFVFLYIGFCKDDILLPSCDAVMYTSTVELSRLCMKPCFDFRNEALIV